MNRIIKAVIPVRKGSERVKNKNVKKFGDSSLLENKIKILKKVKGLDSVVVNSDCPEMLNIAVKYGVEAQKREDYFASSKVNNSEYFEHIAQVTDADHIMYAPVTCPFVRVETIEECISKYQNLTQNDSVMTAFDVKHHMWLEGRPINYDPKNAPNSQDLPEILGVHYGVSIISKRLMIENRNVIGYNPFFIKLNEVEAIDIDTEMEFMFADYMFWKNKNQ